MNFQYWDRRMELLPREELQAFQLQKLKETLGRALATTWYRPELLKRGIQSPNDIKSLADIQRLPLTSKDDLRAAFPWGLVSSPKDDIVRLHASSGTTGTPTTIYYTREDLRRWASFMGRSIYSSGCTKSDVFQNMITYGLFTGGIGFHAGAEEIGMLVIPAGPGNTARQFKLMQDFKTSVLHATPSFFLHLQTKMQEEGVKREDLYIRKAFAGAEPYSEDTRRRIEALLHVDVYNSYGLSEMNGPGVAFECQAKEGMHLWEDGYIAEILDPDSLEPLPDGETGELVLTILCREATTILRYRTRDLTSFYTEACPCGRTHRRIRRITGRTDDMLIINGVNVFPSQIEEVVMGIPELGNNYLINVDKQGALDKLTVKVEVGPNIFVDDTRPLLALQDKIREKLQVSISIRPHVELVQPGSLPVPEGKAKRVIDKRPKD